jgi:Domain of unknown function (DUF4294)
MARNLIHLCINSSRVRILCIITAILLLENLVSGQVVDLRQAGGDSLKGKKFILPKIQRNGERLPEVQIGEVSVVPPPTMPKARKSDLRKYDRLVYNVKKVYPFALIARERIRKLNDTLINIQDEKERKKYLKNLEKRMFAEFEGDIREMTITQGKILIKLIDRETKNTSYELIRDYRGKISAAFWQGIARIFGTNLKDEYDADGDDLLIEMIIKEIDAGNL